MKNKKILKIGVLGSTGRMGQAVINTLQDCYVNHTSIAGTRENIQTVFKDSDVVIDFTTPEALSQHLELAIEYKKPIVVGTTGITSYHIDLLASAASSIGLVVSANMSMGIALLAKLVQSASAMLDTTYDIEITELHHRFKKDAPSGTSLMLGQAAARGRGQPLETIKASLLRTGLRKEGDIGFSVQRGGAVVGDHCVQFLGDEDIIQLSHRGLSRNVYAKGAIRAAQWVVTQQPGLYSLDNILET